MSPLNAPAIAPPERFVLINLLCAIGFGLVAMTICLPSMPQWTELFDVAQANVQLTFSVFVVAFGVTQIIYGPLSDRYGRRRPLQFGFALAALGSLAGAMASDLTALTLARLLPGARAGAGLVRGRPAGRAGGLGPGVGVGTAGEAA